VYLKVDTSYHNPNPQVLFSQVPHSGHFPFRQEGLLLRYLHPQLERPAQLILEVEEHHRSAHEGSVDLVLKAFFKDKLKQAYHGWFMQGIRDIKRLQIITVVEMLWRDGTEGEKDAPLCIRHQV